MAALEVMLGSGTGGKDRAASSLESSRESLLVESSDDELGADDVEVSPWLESSS